MEGEWPDDVLCRPFDSHTKVRDGLMRKVQRRTEVARHWRHERYQQRQWVGGRWIAPLSEEYHGRTGTYSNYGCRCVACTDAMRVAQSTRKTAPAPRRPVDPVPSPPQAKRPQRTKPRKKTKAPRLPITREASAAITDEAHLERVEAAFWRPGFVTPDPYDPERAERRFAQGCMVIVRKGQIVYVGEHEQSTEAPRSLQPVKRAQRRVRGGNGGHWPATWDQLMERVSAAGCEVLRRSSHVVVRVPSGERVTLHHTASDWRALRNACSQFARHGVDLRRAG